MSARVYPRFPVSLRRPSARYGARISLEGVKYRGLEVLPTPQGGGFLSLAKRQDR